MRIFLVLLLLTSMLISSLYNEFSFFNPFELDETMKYIVHDLRFPRVLIAAFVGGALANIGWVYQIHFKNELATPYTLGLSSVAALALAISQLCLEKGILISRDFIFLIMALPLLLLFRMIKNKNMRGKILLLGMGVGILSSSLIVLVQTLLGNESVARLVHWMMGSLNIVGLSELRVVIPVITISFIYSYFHRHRITLLSVGDDFASSRGVDTQRAFILDLIVTSLVMCSMIWVVGPIGFVGIVIPQIVKRIWSANYARYMFESIILGALFLVFCDFVSRNIFIQQQLPIGAITAVIGAPMLVYFILKSRL